MALTSLAGAVIYPTPIYLAGTPQFANWVLCDAANELFGMVFRVPVTGSITKIGFNINTLTTNPSTATVGLVTVDANGMPTTTAYGSSAPATGVSMAATGWHTATLATPATAVAGDIVAVIVTWESGSYTSAVISGSAGACLLGLPYGIKNTGANAAISEPHLMSIEYGSTCYYIAGLYPLKTLTSYIYNTGSANDEYGLRFTLPVPARIWGCAIYAYRAGDHRIRLYDNTPTVMAELENSSTDVDKDHSFGNTGARWEYWMFGSPVNLSANTAYNLTDTARSGSSINIGYFSVNSIALMDQIEGGQTFITCYRDNWTGAFSTISTERPLISLILDQFDGGGDRGGGPIFGGMVVR